MYASRLLRSDLDQAARAADLPKILTVQEAATFVRCHGRTVRRWIASGRLRAAKTHPTQRGRVLIPLENLIRMLAEGVS
jgi:excisionase family DNA binding protein